MSWKNILKSDPCTMETKEMLYDTLQKLGANNELLDEIKNTDLDDLRDMIEELIRTTKHETQKQIFKKILRNWDICILESKQNPTQQATMGGGFPEGFDTKNAMLKAPPDLHPLIERAMKTATTPKTVREIYDEIFNQIDKENKLRTETNESSFSKLRSGKRTISTRIVPNKDRLSALLRMTPWMTKAFDRPKQAQTWVFRRE